MNGPTARLFVALWPSPRVRAALAAQRDRITWPARAAPVPDARLHLTLHFLGDVPVVRLPEIAAALPPPGPAFELRFGTLQVWRGGLVVLCPLALPPALAALHAALGERLRALGLPVEQRRFRPHVTLARHAAGAPTSMPVPLLRWRAAGAVLVQSVPDRGYTVLARATGGPRPVTPSAGAGPPSPRPGPAAAAAPAAVRRRSQRPAARR